MRTGELKFDTSIVMGARPRVEMTPLTDAAMSSGDSLRMMPLWDFGTKTVDMPLTPLKV